MIHLSCRPLTTSRFVPKAPLVGAFSLFAVVRRKLAQIEVGNVRSYEFAKLIGGYKHKTSVFVALSLVLFNVA